MSRTDHRFHVLNFPPLLFIAGWVFSFAMVGCASFVCFYNLARHAQSEALECERARRIDLEDVVRLRGTVNDLGVLYVEETKKKRCQGTRLAIGGGE